MKCTKCGNLIADGSVFCQFCGAKLDDAANVNYTAAQEPSESVTVPETSFTSDEAPRGKSLSAPDFLVYEWSKTTPIKKVSTAFGAVMAIVSLIITVGLIVIAIFPDLYIGYFEWMTYEDVLKWMPLFFTVLVYFSVITKWISLLLDFLSVISMSKWLAKKDSEVDYYRSIDKFAKLSTQKKNLALFGNALVVKENRGAIAPHAVSFAVKTLCQMLVLLFSHSFFSYALVSWMSVVSGNITNSVLSLIFSNPGSIFIGALVLQIIVSIVCSIVIYAMRKKLFNKASKSVSGV